jgi:DNA polymerase III sliding clamp (beta) subunit (PCNA family)
MVKIQSSLLNTVLPAFRKGVTIAQGIKPENALSIEVEHNKCTLTYVSDENVMKYHLHCESNDISKFTVPFDGFNNIINTIDKEAVITIKDNKNKVIITNDKTKARHSLVQIMETIEPRQIENEPICSFTVDPLILFDALDIAKIAVDNEAHRYPLDSICFNIKDKVLAIAATDAKRLVTRSIDIDIDKEIKDKFFIIPSRLLNAFLSFCKISPHDITVTIFENQLIFELKDNFYYAGNIGAGEYPDYKMVIPNDNDLTVSFDTVTFHNTLREISSLIYIKHCGIIIEFLKDNQAKIYTLEENIGQSTSEIPFKVLKGDLEGYRTKIDIKFLNDFVGKVKDDEVIFKMSSEKAKPIQISSESLNKDNTLFIVMPMRFDDEEI